MCEFSSKKTPSKKSERPKMWSILLTQREVADNLGMYFKSISRIIRERKK
jgi:hypothetical protein